MSSQILIGQMTSPEGRFRVRLTPRGIEMINLDTGEVSEPKATSPQRKAPVAQEKAAIEHKRAVEKHRAAMQKRNVKMEQSKRKKEKSTGSKSTATCTVCCHTFEYERPVISNHFDFRSGGPGHVIEKVSDKSKVPCPKCQKPVKIKTDSSNTFVF